MSAAVAALLAGSLGMVIGALLAVIYPPDQPPTA